MRRRQFLTITSLAGLAGVPTAIEARRARGTRQTGQSAMRVIIDADTANEIDDLYAIVRALLEPAFETAGLSAAQWNHRLSPPDTVQRSQRLNEDILALMNRRDIPHPTGSEMIMGKPWGGDEPRDSPAAQLMIALARQMPSGERLHIVSLGAATNVASAIKLAPDIIPRVSCALLGGRYFAERRVWNKDEFNVRNDLNAANLLFNTPDLQLRVMPVNILYDFRLTRDDVMRRLAGSGGIWEYLATRWLTHSPESKTWIMWDLALVIALARPELATFERVRTPPENEQRDIEVYTRIDTQRMLHDWWDTVDRESSDRR
jgi:purine nucleosidase